MKLEELKVYQIAMIIGEKCWSYTSNWDFFAKDTIGKQLVRSADSIAANIAEGFGRFHFKENKNFNFYARGSLFETKTWLEKASSRQLLQKEEFFILKKEMNELGYLLNRYIKSIGSSKIVKEPEASYGNFIDKEFLDINYIPFPNETND